MPRTAPRYALLALLLVTTARLTLAHNGTVAFAWPVTGIVVDGDLSDWPEGMPSYAIGWEGAPRHTDGSDGSFRVAYSAQQNALYLAVTMHDSSILADPGETGEWDVQDGCELWVDARHVEEERGIGYYYIYGNTPGARWGGVRPEDARVAAQRTTGAHHYEWRIDIGGKTEGQVRLESGTSLGLMVALADRDADGWLSWSTWGQFFSGTGRPDALGDVVLAAPGGHWGTLTGELVGDEGEAVGRTRVDIRSLFSPALWVKTLSSPSGAFSLAVPAGRYRIRPERRGVGPVDVEVTAGEEATVANLAVPIPRGETVTAGEGRRTLARGTVAPGGSGRRQGTWHTLGVADGLSDPTVTAIFEDKDGYLWFGTIGGGAVRYDGVDMTRFTAADGLGQGSVQAITQDLEGHLWFGTWSGGLSRYDGRAFVTYTTEDGLPADQVRALAMDREGNLWIGTTAGLCRFDGPAFVTYTSEDGLLGTHVRCLTFDEDGVLWIGTLSGTLSRYDGQRFSSITAAEGPHSSAIDALLADRQGRLWIGSFHGASVFDGEQFAHYDQRSGLGYNLTSALAEDRDGDIWAATLGGISRFDGEQWTLYTTEEGLGHNIVGSVLRDQAGNLWFGTGYARFRQFTGQGVTRYTGEAFASHPVESERPGGALAGARGLARDRQGRIWLGTERGVRVLADGIVRPVESVPYRVARVSTDRLGRIWFATHRGAYVYADEALGESSLGEGAGRHSGIFLDRDERLWFSNRGGVSRSDGDTVITLTPEDGLAGSVVTCIAQDRIGNWWLGTRGAGVSRYDGERFTTLTTADGLASDHVTCSLLDTRGHLWFGTWESGVSRYDGEGFATFTAADGLGHDRVVDIMEDSRGHLWFSTSGGGVTRYDGLVFQTVLQRDGLPNNGVHQVIEDPDGAYWIATDFGVTRFLPSASPPGIRLTGIVADRDYGTVEEIRLPTSQDYLALAYQGTSFDTRSGQLAYVYRLKGHEDEWRTTRQRQVAYRDLPRGDYFFEVKAVDRDLNYSAPAGLRVVVHPAYGQAGLRAGLGLCLMGLLVAGGYGLRRRRERDQAREQLLRDMEEELQTAHSMQMGLMPTSSPDLDGVSISGFCSTANSVGGDFYQYFERDGCWTASLADVTGHSMEAAIPAVMFSGILDKQMEIPSSLEQRFSGLNRSLCRSLGAHTYVCLSMLDLEPATLNATVANCGCPYPLLYRHTTGQIEEIQVEAYPLGIRPETSYTSIEVTLSPGDCVVLHSDGFSEAANAEGQLFGFDRTMEVIRRGCSEGLSPEDLIDRLIGEVKGFTADEPQADDMTCVVIKVDD